MPGHIFNFDDAVKTVEYGRSVASPVNRSRIMTSRKADQHGQRRRVSRRSSCTISVAPSAVPTGGGEDVPGHATSSAGHSARWRRRVVAATPRRRRTPRASGYQSCASSSLHRDSTKRCDQTGGRSSKSRRGIWRRRGAVLRRRWSNKARAESAHLRGHRSDPARRCRRQAAPCPWPHPSKLRQRNGGRSSRRAVKSPEMSPTHPSPRSGAWLFTGYDQSASSVYY